ncbi:Sugar lactone lactonase YvrE [Nocardioides terrae]|uniref:Sugar lactone lactonase YvrE n=1 Tax=Nocardioides terrae TaxID=574651 RepID=A0A1I1GSM6_9ACTN|nr:SMP-30/gluconolactonase/LRE family protein [Nocardioides terrae]SFC14654.1 Sugar lactone lactonase YvrE [Nocardioides terrae]
MTADSGQPKIAPSPPVMDVLATGLGLVESPRWHAGRLWFSDWTAGRIHTIDADGHLDTVVEHRSLPLCFDFLPDGRLVLVSTPERALLTLEADGSLSTYADLAGLSAYGCNDIVVDGRGNAYVNGADFDFATGPPAGGRQPGFVALVRPDGTATRVTDDLAFPNGMAVSADGRTLVVADSYRSELVGFDIADDGTLSGRRVWAALGTDNPDGICLDAEGAAWYADVPHQHCVRVTEGGEVLATVPVDRGAFACMLAEASDLHIVGARWPGAAGLTTYADWDGRVWRVAVPVGGAGWPAR